MHKASSQVWVSLTMCQKTWHPSTDCFWMSGAGNLSTSQVAGSLEGLKKTSISGRLCSDNSSLRNLKHQNDFWQLQHLNHFIYNENQKLSFQRIFFPRKLHFKKLEFWNHTELVYWNQTHQFWFSSRSDQFIHLPTHLWRQGDNKHSTNISRISNTGIGLGLK